MNPQIEGTQTSEKTYEVTARPDHGKPVTLYVKSLKRPRCERFYVSTSPSADDYSFITQHPRFEAAVKSANLRAKRYVHAYSKPRGIQAVMA